MDNMKVRYLNYSTGFSAGFDLNNLLGMARNKAESAAAGSTAGQMGNLKTRLDPSSKKKSNKIYPQTIKSHIVRNILIIN